MLSSEVGPGVNAVGIGLVGEPEGVTSNSVRGWLGSGMSKPEILEDGQVRSAKLVVGEFSPDGSVVRLPNELVGFELRAGVVDGVLVYLPNESRCLVVVPVLIRSTSVSYVFCKICESICFCA
jgi:hypothetical protein